MKTVIRSLPHLGAMSSVDAGRLRQPTAKPCFAVLAAISLIAITGIGCYRRSPTVDAAENFRSTVFDLIGSDEEQTGKLNSLRVGMSDSEVLAAAGPPRRREAHTEYDGATSELWIYDGQFWELGRLTFVNGKLTAIDTNPQPTPTR